MIKNLLEKLADQQDLRLNEAKEVMLNIMNGEVNQSQMAAFLMALKVKGETAEEIAGFAQAMREKSVKLKSESGTIDLCGTGGDYSGSFNISTAASFVVAGSGVKVAKHGNKSISSKSGSADVLKELGININLSPDMAEKALADIGITFLFAPSYHPAMRHVAPVRKELRMKTVFNMLGPLTNPAGTKRQLIGTFDFKAAELMAKATDYLDMEHVCFICTANKFDEISLTDNTNVYEYSKSAGLKQYPISAQTFGYEDILMDDILGDTPTRNAQIIQDLLQKKEKNAVFFVTVANAAMALYCAGFETDLKNCTHLAEESILSGKALEKLNQLRSFGN
jgi:anthranilate phosphoribosyltransferase